MRVALFWLAELAVFFALWLLFTWSLERAELLFGVGSAAIAATASRVVARCGLARFWPRPSWLALGWRVALDAVVDTGVVLRVLARHLAGRPAPSLLRAVRFDAC